MSRQFGQAAFESARTSMNWNDPQSNDQFSDKDGADERGLLGLSSPYACEDWRDITAQPGRILASRLPMSNLDTNDLATAGVPEDDYDQEEDGCGHAAIRPSSSTASNRADQGRSTPVVFPIHPFIPPPVHVQRSQSIQLKRSSSSIRLSPSSEVGGEKMKGSDSTTSISSTQSQREGITSSTVESETHRIIRSRSDSLPVFPPAEVERISSNRIELLSLGDLPANPKLWLPSHLSVFLSHQLSLQSPLVVQDITHFIRSSGLSGRTFLRLHDQDMEEMGINVVWRRVLNEAREELRRQSLGGKIWGFEGGRASGEMSFDESIETEDTSKEDWKKSWRYIKGKKSRGRVKGMAQVFESTSSSSSQSPQLHRRSDSMSSTASIDSGSELSSHASPPTPFTLNSSPASPTHDTNRYQSAIMSHSEDINPYGLVRRSSAVSHPGNSKESVIISHEAEDAATLKSSSSAQDSKSRGTLSDLFGLEIATSSGNGGVLKNGDGNDLVSAKLGDGKGSLIIVKRSQLDELEKRMAEVEAQLALTLATPSSTIFVGQTASNRDSLRVDEMIARNWVSSAFAENNDTLPMSWTALGGYCLAASIGIGLVAGEVVVSKLFGVGIRR